MFGAVVLSIVSSFSDSPSSYTFVCVCVRALVTILEQKRKSYAFHLEYSLELTINLLEVEMRCPLRLCSPLPISLLRPCTHI